MAPLVSDQIGDDSARSTHVKFVPRWSSLFLGESHWIWDLGSIFLVVQRIRFCRALSLQQRDWIEAVSILSDVMADPVSITLFHASEGAMDQGWCRPTHKEQRQGVGSVGGGVLTVRCSPGRAWTPLGFAGIGLDCGLMGLAVSGPTGFRVWDPRGWLFLWISMCTLPGIGKLVL